ncbi:hypothetical protein ACN47E_005656 [Coniothyrium glycines]
MLLNVQTLVLAACLPLLAIGRPFDNVPRAKSYEVVNVDGGQSTPAPPPETSVEAITTVEVQNPGPTITQEVTTTLVQPVPNPTCTSTSSISSAFQSSSTPTSSSSTSISIPTSISMPKPIFVTVTVPEAPKSTEYYDDGMWHTRYPVKSFAPAVVIVTASALVATPTS